MRHAIRTAALVVVTAIATLIVSPPTTKASDLFTVAQATQQQKQNDPHYSSRGKRKLVKLGIIGLFGVVAIGGWAIKKVRGGNS